MVTIKKRKKQNPTKASTVKKKVSRQVKITKDMLIGDILEKYPQSVEIFAKYGFHCIGCMISPHESLEDGAAVHNIPLEPLLKDINAAVK